MQRPSLRRARTIALVIVSLSLAAMALRTIDFRDVVAHLGALSRATLLLAVGLSLAQAVALATRLWSVFPRRVRPTWATVARAFGFGQLANSYLPGRAGDVVKVFAMRASDGTVGDATGVMLADKGLDVLTLALVVLAFGRGLAFGLFTGALHTPHAAWALPCVAAIALLATLALRRWAPRVALRIKSGASTTVRAARGMFTPVRLTRGLAIGVFSWAVEAAILLLLATSIGVHLSFAQAIIGLFVLNLGIAVPVSVANVGAYEASMAVGLGQFGVPMAHGLAIGVLHHAIQLAAVIVFALVFWLRDRIIRRPSDDGGDATTSAGEASARPRLECDCARAPVDSISTAPSMS